MLTYEQNVRAVLECVFAGFREDNIERAVKMIMSLQADREIYGYDLKNLLIFGIACRRAGVENEDLKMFANNLDFAWRSMQAEIDGTFENFIYRLLTTKGAMDDN